MHTHVYIYTYIYIDILIYIYMFFLLYGDFKELCDRVPEGREHSPRYGSRMGKNQEHLGT